MSYISARPANFDVTGNALGTPQPADHNLVAWSGDPTNQPNSSVLTNGTVYLSAVYPARGANITKLYYWISVVGVTPTAGQNFVGLYSSAGTRLQVTGVDADITSTGLKTVTITSQAVTPGSMYWVGMVFNAATPPGISRGTGLSGMNTALMVGQTLATARYATNGTGQTSLPASITPASNVAPGFGGPWVAIGE